MTIYLFSLVNKRPEFICQWKWSDNDVCSWDERTTQHSVTSDYWPHHRKIYRCAITERQELRQLKLLLLSFEILTQYERKLN